MEAGNVPVVFLQTVIQYPTLIAPILFQTVVWKSKDRVEIRKRKSKILEDKYYFVYHNLL